MNTSDNTKLEYAEVPRNLADPVYKISKFGLRLTVPDALIVGVAWFGTFVIFRIIAGRATSAGDFQAGPLVALAVGAVVAYSITALHIKRPELSIERAIKQGGADFSSYCSAALVDKKHSRQSWRIQ